MQVVAPDKYGHIANKSAEMIQIQSNASAVAHSRHKIGSLQGAPSKLDTKKSITHRTRGDDEEEVFEGSELDSADETLAIGGDDFMHTDDFRRLFVGYVMVDTLVAMRWLDRKWHAVVEKKLTELEDEPNGEIIVHGGNEISYDEAWTDARQESMKQVTKVVFLLNITKVGDWACAFASILVVDIPEGITIIDDTSFYECISLKRIKFPKSLTSIGESSFFNCSSLEEVDLLHTNVQELGDTAFSDCLSLRKMNVPDSLQKFGSWVFFNCSKLVPSTIDVDDDDVTSEVVAYLRSIQ
ncbi:hypothetical protein TL16_g06307 [Triparma laevis f. inornata]|uniref:Uncharacterized protein n=2 Tax=Triparma laevis TaxID=1534972 RepID=A0A9W7CC19_9STRA|nr:hypothetical protein TL16_g06307 [Triparma laevis f. inornata]GMI03013.1 hypothetical protein TrLO_g8876 [Triparma laevis f. longispina]